MSKVIGFKGKITRLRDGTDWYAAKSVRDVTSEWSLCASAATEIMTGRYTGSRDENALESQAWGYDGIGPQLLACNILSLYDYDYDGSGGGLNQALRARKYYKEFTTEIVANLPDTWELSAEEVARWVEEKEKQQTKGKDNAREATQTKGTGSK